MEVEVEVGVDVDVNVEEVIDALYGLAPTGFTTARDEAAAVAKRAGDRAAAKRIAGMRRPTLAAWASNLLVRAKPEEAEQFCQLGQALREAHRSLDGEQLRELSHEQHVVIGALAREAVRLAAEAGTPVSESALREVEQILRAVLADPEAAGAWASGRLAKPPAVVTEFPALDPGATRPTPPPAKADPGVAEAAEAQATARARETEQRAADAREAQRTATAREDELRAAERAHRRAVEEAERADAARDRAHAAEAEAADHLRTATRAAERARAAAETAAARLPAAPDGPDAGPEATPR